MILRRTWFRVSLLAAFSFLLGFSYDYHLPKIESFLLIEVERLSREHAPVRIWAKKLHVHLLPLGIVLEDVRVLPKAPIDRYLAPATLRQAGVRLSLLPLLRGEIRLAQVFIRDSDLNVFLRPELFAAGKQKAPAQFDFDRIYRLPIDEILLERVQLRGRLDPQNVVFQARDLNLLIENRYRSLFVELEAPETLVKPSGRAQPLQTQLELRTLIEAHEMQISAFKVKADDSFVVASGRFNGDFAKGRVDNGALDVRAKVNLADVNVWEKVFFVEPRVPPLSGRAEVNVGVEVRGGRGSKLESDVTTKDLRISKYTIGGLNGHVRADFNDGATAVTSERLDWTSDAGQVAVKNLKLALGPTREAEAHVSVAHLEVGHLLENLSVKNVPIVVETTGEVDCKASLVASKPEATCQGSVGLAHLLIYGRDKVTGHPDTIVEAHDGRAKGEVKINSVGVEYTAEAELGKKSRGRSKGVVSFEDGFKISYEGDRLDFGDVKNLANLKLSGDARVTGTTVGNAHQASLELTAQGRNIWLEDYALGTLNSRVAYKAGHLTFAKTQGMLGTTQYAGDLDLNLPAKQIKLSLNLPFADLHDVQDLFQRKVKLPFTASGTGQGRIDAQGPLRFRDMSYQLRTSFYRGEVAGESFDELNFNVTSKDGFVKSDRIVFTKAGGRAEMKASVTPKGDVEAALNAHGFRLEQSENVARIGLDIQGLADFDLKIAGQLPAPHIELNGRMTRMVMADQPTPDSSFRLNFLSDRVEGSGAFLGQTLTGQVTYPYTNDAPFVLNLKADRWDFSNLFTAVSRSARQLDYATSISGQVSLSAARGGFWASTGTLELSEFLLRKGGKQMSNSERMKLIMNDGEVNSSNFSIANDDGYLKLDVAGLRRNHLNASLNGKLDLSLLGVFTPFISDLRGNLAISTDLHGSLDQPGLSGSAYVEKGYAKLREFPHPFANVRADVLFNDNQALINSLRADLGGGRLALEGRLGFEHGKRPLDVRGTFNDVTLNVPDGFKTRGSGTVAMYGTGFPYTLGINYAVAGGEVTSEFGDQQSSTATVKASNYLPRFVAQDTFHPFTLNVDVSLKNPITVSNQLMQLQVNGQINATGTPDRILLTGSLTPQPGGRVFFNNQPFELTSAFIEYSGNPPANPKIYLMANTRVTSIDEDQQGRQKETPYEVNLLAQGRGPIPQILLTSQPPLSQREVVSLLALGVTSSARDDGKSNNSSAAIGAALLQKAGGKRIKESLGVDVKVSSSQQTADAASTPKVTLSKQWTPNFSGSASSTLQANPTNNVKVQYNLNKSMSVIGSWDGREYDPIQKDPVRNVFGLDLEYKKQFR